MSIASCALSIVVLNNKQLQLHCEQPTKKKPYEMNQILAIYGNTPFQWYTELQVVAFEFDMTYEKRLLFKNMNK